MPFKPDDNYCGVSGGAGLLDFWQPTVTKFDTSAFYNWEEDNLPVYDLEERTDLLWEKLGYATSCCDDYGVAIVVSSTAPGTPPNHQNVYSSINAAVDALPEVIRFPILIEVAASGELGELNLKGLQFDRNGCLEIVNRLYARVNADVKTATEESTIKAKLASGYISQLSSIDLSSTMEDSSAISVQASVFDADSWVNYNKSYVQLAEYTESGSKHTERATFTNGADGGNPNFLVLPDESFTLAAYEVGSPDSTIDDYDIVVKNGFTGTETRREKPDLGEPVHGFMYGNSLSSINIENCGDKVYIRGFIVDGASGTDSTTLEHVTEAGILVKNSSIVLENCTSVRNRKYGLHSINSNVVLNRGFAAYRNYDIIVNTGTRKRIVDSAGMLADNSVITLSATGDALDRGLAADEDYVRGRDALFAFTRNTNGIILRNSTLTGGKGRFYRFDAFYGSSIELNSDNYRINYLQSFYNTENGILAEESVIDTQARVTCFQNKRGIHMKGGVFLPQEFLLEYNQKEGLLMEGATCIYNPKLAPAAGKSSLVGTQFQFNINGQHLKMHNSVFKGVELSASPYAPSALFAGLNHMELLQGRIDCTSAHGTVEVTPATSRALPGVEIINSEASFINSRFYVDDVHFSSSGPVEGVLVKAVGSKVNFLGTDSCTTLLLGPETYGGQSHWTAALYAGGGSKVRFSGPTAIGQVAIDALVDDQSTLDFLPHDNIDTWNLSSVGNHTSVELHSTRACLVADNNSTINMKDLGDYHAYWSDEIKEILVYDTANSLVLADYNAQDGLNLEYTTSGGYMQFYPNPQVPDSTTFINAVEDKSTYDLRGALNNVTRKYILEPLGGGNHQGFSYGGMCVRAMNGSKINVKNVHFPTGWENPSGIWYDVSSDCSRLYIWNIADDSELRATYVSVSGTWPTSSIYHGPSSVYGELTGDPASGAPSSTLNTSSLSILDTFGLSAAVASQPDGVYGKSTFDNRGPFRIYFSPLGPAKFLGYVSGTDTILVGAPYQTLAQGYSLSGDCSSTVSGVKWNNTGYIYQELFPELKEPLGVNSDASSFFYVSSMLDPNSRARVFLDDSAMNLFANAKNATLGTSGRLKLVNYIKVVQEAQGESFDAAVEGYGLGFLSANTFDLDRKN